MNNEDSARSSQLSPTSRSKIYSLGIALNSKCSSIFKTLLSINQNMRNHTVIRRLIQQNKYELQVLNKRQKFELNCAFNRFYQSGGLVTDSGIITDSLAHKLPLISRKIENIFCHLDRVQALLSDYKSGYYFDVNDPDKTLTFCMDIRQDISELYVLLSDIYPDGEIQNALHDLIVIVDTTNKNMELAIEAIDSNSAHISKNYLPLAVSI